MNADRDAVLAELASIKAGRRDHLRPDRPAWHSVQQQLHRMVAAAPDGKGAALAQIPWISKVPPEHALCDGLQLNFLYIALQPNVYTASLRDAIVLGGFSDGSARAVHVHGPSASRQPVQLRQWIQEAIICGTGKGTPEGWVQLEDAAISPALLAKVQPYDAMKILVRTELCAIVLRETGVSEDQANRLFNLFANQGVDVFGPALWQVGHQPPEVLHGLEVLDPVLLDALCKGSDEWSDPTAHKLLEGLAAGIAQSLAEEIAESPGATDALAGIGIDLASLPDLASNPVALARTAALNQELRLAFSHISEDEPFHSFDIPLLPNPQVPAESIASGSYDALRSQTTMAMRR